VDRKRGSMRFAPLQRGYTFWGLPLGAQRACVYYRTGIGVMGAGWPRSEN
jgi:hypothetical protein